MVTLVGAEAQIAHGDFGLSLFVRHPMLGASTTTLASGRLRARDRARTVINLLGRPGSGKGTQGQLLAHRLELPLISIGELFRAELYEVTSPLGDLLRHHFNQSSADPPSEIAIGLLVRRLSELPHGSGFILEGFPRTLHEATALIDVLLRDEDRFVPLVLELCAQTALERTARRHWCRECKLQFATSPGNVRCPACGSALAQRREDADSEYAARRSRDFYAELPAIVACLAHKSPVATVTIDPAHSPELVCQRILDLMGQCLE